nr:MAG TPA: hypothetical protein [Caudoviricetes sp.]
MISVPDNVINELARHLPMIMENMPKVPHDRLRLQNAIRVTKLNIKKLKKLSDERKQQKD